MRIYNLFPLLAGKFHQWEPHLERAVQMGFNWLFVNPVQRTGRSGSLYSIADYFALNPLLVDATSSLSESQQFQAVLAKAHGLGLSVIVDLVINHCAIDAPLVSKEPQWFLREAGKVQHRTVSRTAKKCTGTTWLNSIINNVRTRTGYSSTLPVLSNT